MSTQVGMGECCLSGKLQSGTPQGREDTIGGLNCYIAEPNDQSKSKTVIFITDIFGWKLTNTRLLADNYAKAGFYTYVPDVQSNHFFDEEFLQDIEPPLSERANLSIVDKGIKTAKVGAQLGPWLISHREAVSKPIIEGFINAVRGIPGTNKIGTIGFCWGGRYSILAAHGLVDAAYACHPSLLSIPHDFDPVTKPLSLAMGSADSLLDMNQVKQIQEVLAKKDNTEVKVYENQVHGFSLRGDFSSEEDKKAMDAAEKQGHDWFNKYLS